MSLFFSVQNNAFFSYPATNDRQKQNRKQNETDKGQLTICIFILPAMPVFPPSPHGQKKYTILRRIHFSKKKAKRTFKRYKESKHRDFGHIIPRRMALKTGFKEQIARRKSTSFFRHPACKHAPRHTAKVPPQHCWKSFSENFFELYGKL